MTCQLMPCHAGRFTYVLLFDNLYCIICAVSEFVVKGVALCTRGEAHGAMVHDEDLNDQTLYNCNLYCAMYVQCSIDHHYCYIYSYIRI